MWVRIAVLAGTLAVTAGCSGLDNLVEHEPGPQEKTRSEELCALISPGTIGEVFGGTYGEGEPDGTDMAFRDVDQQRTGPLGDPGCRFVLREPAVEDTTAHEVRVTVSREKTEPDPLGRAFEDEVYEEVDGLGDAAGFVPRFHDAFDKLVVVSEFGDETRFIEVTNHPLDEPVADRARPIAEEVLEGLDG